MTKKDSDNNTPVNQTLDSAKDLIAANDCVACHQERENMIGPSFVKIAQRYSSKDIPMLIQKIIKGGQGNWGEIPMTAHPGLSELEATEMANYILKMR